MLFDRGFAMSAGGQKLDALPASAVTTPPDMRDAICRGRGRAAMLAMQEDFVASAMAEAPGFVPARRAPAMPMMAAAFEAPPPSGPVADEKVAFEPVKVFVGPMPGWTGPVLAARGGAERGRTPPRSAPIPATRRTPSRTKPSGAPNGAEERRQAAREAAPSASYPRSAGASGGGGAGAWRESRTTQQIGRRALTRA